MSSHTVTTQELTTARAVVLAADPGETDESHGVALITAGGGISWTAWGADVIASTKPIGFGRSTDVFVPVSRRLVEFGATLAEQDGDVVLVVDDGGATLTIGSLSVTFDHPAPRPLPSPVEPFDGCAAQASLPARALFRLFAMGRVLPAGVDLDGVEAPPFDVLIADGSVVAAVDWSAAGAPATRFAVGATTVGEGTASVSPVIAAHVVGFTDPDEDVTIRIPEGSPWIELECAGWTARVRANPVRGDTIQDGRQEELPFVDTIEVLGGLRDDPLAGASLTDVRAFAIDPDVQARLSAAASRWNWDVRVQLDLAGDDDERVVLALLDHVDPYREVCDVIIDGPHVAARRVLAGRNLLTALLERLAEDADPLTAETAKRTLAARAGRPQVEVTR